jgi:agmatinase
MSMTPTFATRPSFLGTANSDHAAPVCVAGVPFDIGTTNRSGSRFGPAAIRQASRMLVDGDNPANWRRVNGLPFADIGDFAIKLGETIGSLAAIEEQAARFEHLITLGGDHTITLPLLRALAKRRGGAVGLIHFDAHVDTWPDSFGQPYGHGSVFYHAINEGLVDPKRMVQIGIRSPVEREIWDWTIAQGVTILTAEQVHDRGLAATIDAVCSIVGTEATYLSFDIDALDPAFAPGTGTPEIGGLATWQALGIMRRLEGIHFVGMDMVEVLPAHDHAELTSLAAATFAWQYLSLLDL